MYFYLFFNKKIIFCKASFKELRDLLAKSINSVLLWGKSMSLHGTRSKEWCVVLQDEDRITRPGPLTLDLLL